MRSHRFPSCAVGTIVFLTLVIPAAADTVLAPPSDLRGHWTFDVDANSSVGEWAGTVHHGATVAQGGAVLGDGCYGNGAGEGFIETGFTALKRTWKQSVSVWVKTDGNTGASDLLFGWGYTGGNSKRHSLGLAGNDLRVELSDSVGETIPPNTPLNDGTWHHVVMVYDPPSWGGGLAHHRFYVDGKFVGAPTGSDSNSASRTAIHIGAGYKRVDEPDADPERDFNGRLDDFGIFASALSDADVALINGIGRIAGLGLGDLRNARSLAKSPPGAEAMIGDRRWVSAANTGGTTGDFGGSLSGGDAWIAVDDTGRGIRILPDPPAPGPNPFRLTGVPTTLIVQAGDRVTRPIQVENTGAAVAVWQGTVVDADGAPATLEQSRGSFVRNATTILATLPDNISEFGGGETGTQIEQSVDGIYGPFNGGNILETDLGGPLEYSNSGVTASPALGTDGRYFTLKLPGLFLFGGDLDGAGSFDARGYATTSATATPHEFTFTHGGRTWQGLAVTRDTSSGFAVHELVLIDDPTATQKVDIKYSSRYLSTPVHFGGKRRLYYATFATLDSPGPPDDWHETLAATLMSLLPDIPRDIEVVPGTAGLPGGASGPAELSIDASRTIPGTYPFFIDVKPLAGVSETVRVPVTLTVDEPALRFSPSTIVRAGITTGPAETVDITVESADGPPPFWSASLVDHGPWATLVTSSGSGTTPIRLRLDPSLAPQTGIHRTILEVRSGTARFEIPVIYTVDQLNARGGVFSDPLRNVTYVLNSGAHGGAMLVMNPYQQTMLRSVRVGLEPRDLAFSPDGSEIYVIGRGDMVVTRIDADSLEVTAHFRLPGPIRGWSASPGPRIAAGANGRVFYTDKDYHADLRLVDCNTGELLDTMSPGELPDRVGVSRGFADIFLDPREDRLYFTRHPGVAAIGVLDTQGDQLTVLGEFDAPISPSYVDAHANILSDLNAKDFYVAQMVHDRAALDDADLRFDAAVLGLSAYGELAITRSKIHDTRSGEVLDTLPDEAWDADFTPDQRGVFYVGNGQMFYHALPVALRPPPIGIRPVPADGGAIEFGEDTLSWSGLPFVDGYRIYLGTDEAAVAAATPGSPEDMGMVTGHSFQLDPAPDSGTFFWRVDAIRGGQAIAGDVFSFAVAPFRVTPNEVAVTAPHGARPQEVVLAPTNDLGEPVAWSVTGTESWISFPSSSGTAADPLTVLLNPAGLTVGIHSGTIRVTGEGLTVEIPVSLELFEVDIHDLKADPNRPLIYGLQTGEFSGPFGAVILIDPASADYLSSIALDGYTRHFAIHPLEDRLYVSLKYDARIQVFDLKTGKELPSIAVEDADQIGDLAAGPAGRLHVEVDESARGIWAAHTIDTTTGADLGDLPRGSLDHDEAFLASDPTGRFVYRNRYRAIQRFDAATAPATLLESGTVLRNSSDDGESFLSISSGDGRVVAYQSVFDAELNLIATLALNGQSITSDGQIVASAEAIYWADTGLEIARLPIGSAARTVAFSADDQYLLSWASDRPGTLTSTRLDALVELPGPLPRPGQQLGSAPDSLAWSPVPDAIRYRVYLGTNESGVTSAGPGSPLQIGAPSEPSLPLTNPLRPGDRYYWRVDALTPTGTVTGLVHFFDLPFQANGNPILHPEDAISGYSDRFGQRISAGPDGVFISETNRVLRFRFDPSNGDHSFEQEFSGLERWPFGEFGMATTTGPGVFVAGDTEFNEPTDNSGGAFVFRPSVNGSWSRTATLPQTVLGGVSYIGHELAFDANQLLVTGNTTWLSSGRVFPFFEWNNWHRGPEIIPNPSEENDYFGAAIAMDGTRALIGAPGEGPFITGRKGSAFIFEYDAGRQQWNQKAHLRPARGEWRDNAGLAVALSGNHAALGSGRAGAGSIYDLGKVHVFRRGSRNAWSQVATLEDPISERIPGFESRFGHALAFHEDVLFVSHPYATWRGQRGGVIYPYRYRGGTWTPMAPMVAPRHGAAFGESMVVHDGHLFVSQYQASSGPVPDRVHVYRLAETPNRSPLFASAPPLQMVSGVAKTFPVEVSDPDGNDGLIFSGRHLPPGTRLQDLGSGRAVISGTPTSPAGSEQWIRIEVRDAQGATAVQTAIVEMLSVDDIPVINGLPDAVSSERGEELRLQPAIGGRAPFAWEWKRDGIVLPGQTGPALVIPWMTDADAGTYTLTVSNVVGSVTSDPVAVSVRPADRFAGDWTTFGSEGGHDGHQAATLGRHTFQPVWQTPPLPNHSMNRAVIVGDRIYATTRDYHGIMDAMAFNAATGETLWTHTFANASLVGPPTWNDGRLYIQRLNRSSDSQLWCLDAATGTPAWSAPFSTQSSSYEAPVVSELGAFMAGGYGSGLYGFNLDGSERFFRDLPQFDEWTPVLHDGRLFTWVAGAFIEHDPTNGLPLWSIERDSGFSAWSMETVPAVKGGRAYLLSTVDLLCVDIDTRQIVWEVNDFFRGSPAVAKHRVFVMKSTTVHAFSAVDGAELATYETGADPEHRLVSQPLVLNDVLVVSNEENTYVFDIASAEILQQIPHGGHLSYAGGQLIIAGFDGALRACFANAAPEFTASMPVEIDSGGAAADMTMALAPFAGDLDPADALTWSIVSVSRPEVFRTIEIAPGTGNLTVVFNPWQSDSSDVVVAIADPAGNVTESTITFTVPAHPDPQAEVDAAITLNRQTGLYEHAITVTNTGQREIAGFDLNLSGLPEGVTVHNASAAEAGVATIHHRQPLGAGAAVTLVLEYHAPVRGTVLDPEVAVSLVTEPDTDPPAPDGGVMVERCMVQPDGSALIEFAAMPGALYEVHYSDDAESWKLSPTRVRAAGNRVQWIDRGPPRTDSPPAGEPCRFYRVRQVVESTK